MKSSQAKTKCPSSVGQASGKLILMGEHSVVYGQPAIALPFAGVGVTATVSPSNHPLSVACDFYRGVAYAMPEVLRSLKHAIHLSLQTIEELGLNTSFVHQRTRQVFINNELTLADASFSKSPHLHIEIDSTIPAERGMGSSAAVAVAVTRGLFNYFGQELSEQNLWRIVQEAETIAHGNPSGIDTATTSGTRPIYYIKDQVMDTMEMNMDAVLVVADSGKTGHTLEAVQAVKTLLDQEKLKGKSLLIEESIHDLGRLTNQAKDALENNLPNRLGDLMNQAHERLQNLTISNDQLDSLVARARQAGALGAKLTGGGRGGCMIALAANMDQATTIAQELSLAGASQTWHHPFTLHPKKEVDHD